jgi:LPXTG-site transpeptidase (sortase) family protein
MNTEDLITKGGRAPRRSVRKNIYYFITGLSAMTFFALIVYFIGYPMLPDINNVKAELHHYSPYNLAYRATIQTFLEISPPVYDSNRPDILIDSDNIDSSGNGAIEEFGDINEEDLADLEDADTVLKVPSASIEGEVVVGASQEDMLRGFWHFPLSSAPNERGNVVIFGHRFDKLPPDKNTFYHLDKVKVGDKVSLDYGKENLNYTVIDAFVIEKDDRSVLQDFGDYRLTLITCTPLWTSDKRLVVVAIQDKVSHAI